AKLDIAWHHLPTFPRRDSARKITAVGAHDRSLASPVYGPPFWRPPMSDPRPTESAAQTPTSGHDAKGRFTYGNKGGPGNPFARQVAALRKVILNRLNEEDLLAITEALLAKAKQGSV